MPVITTNDLKNGMTLELEKELYQVVEFQHVKPGKGHAFVRTKLRGLQNGVVVDRTFRAGEKVERAINALCSSYTEMAMIMYSWIPNLLNSYL